MRNKQPILFRGEGSYFSLCSYTTINTDHFWDLRRSGISSLPARSYQFCSRPQLCSFWFNPVLTLSMEISPGEDPRLRTAAASCLYHHQFRCQVQAQVASSALLLTAQKLSFPFPFFNSTTHLQISEKTLPFLIYFKIIFSDRGEKCAGHNVGEAIWDLYALSRCPFQGTSCVFLLGPFVQCFFHQGPGGSLLKWRGVCHLLSDYITQIKVGKKSSHDLLWGRESTISQPPFEKNMLENVDNIYIYVHKITITYQSCLKRMFNTHFQWNRYLISSFFIYM